MEPAIGPDERPHEDVLFHITKSAVKTVSDGLHLDLSDETTKATTAWINQTAKSIPLFVARGSKYGAVAVGAAAVLYGASETKWGDTTENLTKDAVLGALKGVGMKAGMDLIGAKMHANGLSGKLWAAPATGVAFGVSSTAIEAGLSRSTYSDQSGQYRGLVYGLENTVKAVGNVTNLATGAATFTLATAAMRGLQVGPVARALPELMSSRTFQSAATGFSFGAFAGVSEEAHRQVAMGGFSPFDVSKFDFGQIAAKGFSRATSDATGAVIGGRIGMPSVTIEQVQRIDRPPNENIRKQSDVHNLVEQPLRSSVALLWHKNIKTLASGVFHNHEPRWSGFGSPAHIGEYQPPYYQYEVLPNRRSYRSLNMGHGFPAEPQPNQKKSNGEKPLTAYVVIDDGSLSAENKLIARELGRVREDFNIEVQVNVEPGTKAQQLETAMLEIARRFQPQPMTWGFETPIQYYRRVKNVETGVPTDEWLAAAVKDPEFTRSGMIYDPTRNLIFGSKQLAEKYDANPPPEPQWYRGPDIFGGRTRGGWRQAYNQAAVHLYSPSGQRVEMSANPRTPTRNFEMSDLIRPENADYYLADKSRFFELFGTKAFDTLADRHWLELRKVAFESVEKHWPAVAMERDRAINLGTVLLARACEQYGYFTADEAGTIGILVPKYLWREPSGRKLTADEAVYAVNKIYYDMFQAKQIPFDHTFGKHVAEVVRQSDLPTDQGQFLKRPKRSLEEVLTQGWDMEVHPRYAPLLKEILQKQKEGYIPERFETSASDDGMTVYTPVYRRATAEERIIPLSELIKNLRIVDYGFGELGKVSLASHDIHDHARVFSLLKQNGILGDNDGQTGYGMLMTKLANPERNSIFNRQGELVAQVAYDWRNYFDSHPSYDPAVNLKDVRDYFINADSKGLPLTKNQARALSYLEERIAKDPEGASAESKIIRHILGGVWVEMLEQKRKTDTTLWKREDGTYQRMSPTNPEYLAFAIDAARVLQKNHLELWYQLNLNNLKMERYLRGIATQADGAQVSKLHYSPQDITNPEKDYGAGLPSQTVGWMTQHPGFNTRRAPIRDWVLGFQSEYDKAEAKSLEAMLADRRKELYSSMDWRLELYGPTNLDEIRARHSQNER